MTQEPLLAWADPALAAAIWAGITLLLLGWRRVRTDIVALMSLAVGVAAGLVPVDAAAAGFAGTAVLVLAAAAVVAAGLERSGLAAWPARMASRGTAPGFADLAGMGVLTALCGALVGRTSARAVLAPAVAGAGNAAVLRLLVEFACLLGGMATLVGGVPNLLVSDLRAHVTGQPFAFADFLPVGGALCLGALVLLGVFARPGRGGDWAVTRTADDQSLGAKVYVSEVMIPAGAALVNRTVGALEAGEDNRVRVTAIVREGFRRHDPRPDMPVEAGDVLVLACEPDILQRWMERYGLRIVGDARGADNGRGGDVVGVVEAVVTPASELVGHTTEEARLDGRFGISLLAVGRGGARPAGRLHRTKLRAGDVLVLQGRPERMNGALAALGCLKLAERRLRLGKQRGNAVPPLVLVAALAAVVVGGVPLWLALLAAALAIVVSAVLDANEAYDAVPWAGLVVVGAMIPLAHSIADSGLAAILAEWTAPAAMLAGAYGTVACALVLSMLAVALVGAVAATLVLAPVMMALATTAGLSADMLLMAVALGASADLLSNRGTPGGLILGNQRRTTASRRAGLVLAVLVILGGTVLIPLVWGAR